MPGVFGQRYDSAGNPLGGEFQINTYTTKGQLAPAVAADSDGDFVVVWYSQDQDGSGTGIFGQRFDSGGTASGSELQVNVVTTGGQLSPDVAVTPGGDFVVAWQDGGPLAASASEVFARRFDASGSPLGAVFQANTYTTGPQSSPSVAVDAAGDIVVAWTDGGGFGSGQDGSGAGAYAQALDASGSALGGEFRVNTTTADSQTAASVAMGAGGDFVVAWEGNGSGDYSGVFAQRYAGNFNQPPEARCQDVTVSAGELCLAEASIDDGSSDPDGDAVILSQDSAAPPTNSATPWSP